MEKMATSYSASFLLCVGGDLLTSGLQMHLYLFFLLLATPDPQRSGERIWLLFGW